LIRRPSFTTVFQWRIRSCKALVCLHKSER